MHIIHNQSTIGLRWSLLLLILTPLSVCGSVYVFEQNPFWVTILWMCCTCWLFTGLFITAHDSMHNAIVPDNPILNKNIGTAALLMYAGLRYSKLLDGHINHHRFVATESDPDYLTHTTTHEAFLGLRWYTSFLRSYLTWHPFVWMSIWFTLFDRVLGISAEAMVWCWLTPQVLSTVQLFYFGTYLPHRGSFEEGEIPARSNQYPEWLSLLTCFHFGYHKEHHEHPYVPWWYLPKIRSVSEAS